MFIDCKYTTWYYNIITNAKSRGFTTKKEANTMLGYVEKHHIVPKSLRGTDDKNNLVFLSGREHFICHWLLVKMTHGNDYEKMVFALNGMRRNNSSQNRYDTNITSRIYEKYKTIAADIRRSHQLGGKQTPESNLKRSQALLGKKRGPMSETHRINISASLTGRSIPCRQGVPTVLRGKTYAEIMGEENAKKVLKMRSDAWTNRIVSDSTRLKQSQFRKGKKTGYENSNAKSFTFNDVEYKTIDDAIAASGLSRYKFNKLYRGFKNKSKKK